MGIVFVFIKNKSRKNPGGFTLLELMITCLIVSVLVMIAIPLYRQAIFRAQEQIAVNNLYSIYQAEKQYLFDENSPTPGQYSGFLPNLTSYVDLEDANDNYWVYLIALDVNVGFIATAQYIGDNTRQIDIDGTGSLTFTNWPPP